MIAVRIRTCVSLGHSYLLCDHAANGYRRPPKLERSLSGHQNAVVVVFQVTDTGVGIRADDVAKLFKPFSQINPQKLQQGRGSGLGLNIAKKLVELHGGQIQVFSVLGKVSHVSTPLSLPPLLFSRRSHSHILAS